MSKKPEPVNFEQSLKDLEELVERMEEGELSLEDSLKSFESGMSLSRRCQEALDQAEQRIQILLAQETGLDEQPFALDDD